MTGRSTFKSQITTTSVTDSSCDQKPSSPTSYKVNSTKNKQSSPHAEVMREKYSKLLQASSESDASYSSRATVTSDV